MWIGHGLVYWRATIAADKDVARQRAAMATRSVWQV